jgi:hypothetical protein
MLQNHSIRQRFIIEGSNETTTLDKDIYCKAMISTGRGMSSDSAIVFKRQAHAHQEHCKVYPGHLNFCKKQGAKATLCQRRQKLEALELCYTVLQKWTTGVQAVEDNLEKALLKAIPFLEGQNYAFNIIGEIALIHLESPRLFGAKL